MIRAHCMFSSRCEAPKKIINRLSCPSLYIMKYVNCCVLHLCMLICEIEGGVNVSSKYIIYVCVSFPCVPSIEHQPSLTWSDDDWDENPRCWWGTRCLDNWMSVPKCNPFCVCVPSSAGNTRWKFAQGLWCELLRLLIIAPAQGSVFVYLHPPTLVRVLAECASALAESGRWCLSWESPAAAGVRTLYANRATCA